MPAIPAGRKVSEGVREFGVGGQFILPQTRHRSHRPSPRCLDAPVPVGVPAQVCDVDGLRLMAVEDEAQRWVWNTLLATEHPHGTTTFVGCSTKSSSGTRTVPSPTVIAEWFYSSHDLIWTRRKPTLTWKGQRGEATT